MYGTTPQLEDHDCRVSRDCQWSHKEVRGSARANEMACGLIVSAFVSCFVRRLKASIRYDDQYLFLFLFGSIGRCSLTFAPESGRSSQTPGLGNSSPVNAPLMVLTKQMIQTRTMIAVRTSAMTPKNAESSSALNVIVADATPPKEYQVSMPVVRVFADAAEPYQRDTRRPTSQC